MGRAQRFECHHAGLQGTARPGGARWWPDAAPASETVAQDVVILTDASTLPRGDADTVLLIVGIDGAAHVVADGFAAVVEPEAAALVAAGTAVSVVPIDAARMMVLRLSRARIQILDSRRDCRPRLLRRVSLPVGDPDLLLQRFAVNWMRQPLPGTATTERVTRLAMRLLRAAGIETVWRTSRPLERAIDLLLANPAESMDPARIASRAGITEKSLQRGLQACTGLTLGQFVTEARLAAARAALSNMRETRSIGVLAHRIGFQDASSFARAYRRRFGEAPSVTRARCVAASDYSSVNQR
jgi:AraC-like DNA-binding protein